jgi:hypothetical protein
MVKKSCLLKLYLILDSIWTHMLHTLTRKERWAGLYNVLKLNVKTSKTPLNHWFVSKQSLIVTIFLVIHPISLLLLKTSHEELFLFFDILNYYFLCFVLIMWQGKWFIRFMKGTQMKLVKPKLSSWNILKLQGP